MPSSSENTFMSLEEYFELLEIPYEEVESATNNFADENLLTQGSSFKVYKGQLLMKSGELVNIVARLTHQVSIMINELIISKILKHKNITSLLNLANIEESKMGGIIINKHESNGSLEKHLSDPTTLTWMRRLQICVGVAHALKYLHYDALENNECIIHANIKCSKILLDHNWEPKLHGFGCAVRAKKHQLHNCKYNGSLPYMDPAYEKTRGLTHKSDVFSFGVCLFEVLFGREATIQNNDSWYFARLARSHYEDRKLDDLIDQDLRKQMNLHSLNIFAETAYSCLKEQRSHRPDMNQVLSKLEKALKLQHKHEHPFTLVGGEGASKHLKGKSLDHLKFELRDIELATNNFSETHCIGSGGYGKVYKAQLKLPKKHSMVAIKRIFSRNEEQGEQGFFAEIEMLCNCKHPNIVSLEGFCEEGEEMILIYEYVSNGSLANYLEKTDNMINLTWAQRIQICLDIAHGLKYLHTSTEDKPRIIHRDIKSDNILLDDNWVAKIGDFGLSKLHHANQQRSTLITNNVAGTELYLDPEYHTTGKLKTKSDVYSFGVVLFEIMCGKIAYDKTYGEKGLPSIVRQCFNEGTLNNLVDPKIMEADENDFVRISGVNQDSLDTFTKIAYKCLAEKQSERPTMEVIIKELEKALTFQNTAKDSLHISLKAIKLGTHFSIGRFWKLYKGEVAHRDGCTPILAKCWDKKSLQLHQFRTELDILSQYKHANIIGLVGYCCEMDENIVVYEHASNGTLDKHLGDPYLTWMKRLKVCIDVANGLRFLHKDSFDFDHSVTHRDIRSGSILLDDDWNAKIHNFEMSCKSIVIERAEHVDDNCCSSRGYVDPEYQDNGYLTRDSDIYSFGVILIELLCGRLAWTEECEQHSQSLVPLAKRHYEQHKNLDEMIFEGIKKQIVPQSLTTFQTIALKCLELCGDDRPEISDVIVQLKKALDFQSLHIPLKAIELGTQNFSDCNLIGTNGFFKLYEGEVGHDNGCTPILAKQWDRKFDRGHIMLKTELDFLINFYKHENIVGLFGYCVEMGENIIVYERASNGSLCKHLGDPSLTWMKRLKICIDVAKGLKFLHGNHVAHRYISSGSILLDGDWNAKISNFEMSIHIHESHNLVDLIEQTDLHALGVVSLEMLCGRLAWGEGCENHSQSLGPLAVRHYNEKGNLDEMIFESIKKQIAPQSLTTFLAVAIDHCLKHNKPSPPGSAELVTQLENALEFQVDHETWEHKLPVDYTEIIRASKLTPKIMKKDLYDMFYKGILLQGDNVLFSLGDNEKRNEMISARKFSYKCSPSHKWRSVPESRFPKVLKMFDSSNLKIHINIRTQFLSPLVCYKVHLIFRFCSPKISKAKKMYVNLKYKMGNETMHAYYATRRDDRWMMIELFQFLSHKKDTDFEVLLESFSRGYCGRHSVYIEGIQFQATKNVKNEEIDKLKEVQQFHKSKLKKDKLCPSKMKVKKDDMKWFWLNEIKRKKDDMLSAKNVVVHNSSTATIQSRYTDAVGFPREQVFRIKCKIKSQLLSANRENGCYLVFKLSNKCRGLHGPVIVRDLSHSRSKDTRVVYFRSPSPWNLQDTDCVSRKRKDGWMEVILWKFNSCYALKNDHLFVHLKLITYEGTMSGLIVRKIEFRYI